MKKILFVVFIGFITITGSSQSYIFNVDLTKSENNSITVLLKCPTINKEEILFHFPAVIPGDYEWSNYGKFINDLTCYDDQGNKLDVTKINDNSYLLKNASKLYEISYEVQGTWNSKKGKGVAPTAGTNFIKDEVFLFNNAGIFGYFEGMLHLPIKLKVKTPENFYGVSSIPSKQYNGHQIFKAYTHHELIDAPILFSLSDTSSIMIGNTKITVGIYDEAGTASSKVIIEELQPYFEALSSFCKGILPVENYTFLIYLKDMREYGNVLYNEKLSAGKILKHMAIKYGGVPKLGALEHNQSSFFYLANLGKPDSYINHIKRSAIHEFLHIYTPLSLHSEIIGDFDYAKPKMSKHLWLYEGVTDYHSWLVKMKAGIISTDNFLNDIMRLKMFVNGRFPGEMTFTQMSENILEKPFSEQFSQVYEKGTITAFMLDLEIMRLTKGKKSLEDIFFELVNKYGKDKSFNEDGIFEEITQMVHPELWQFFQNHIIENMPFNYNLHYETIGVVFQELTEEEVPLMLLDPDKGYGVRSIMESFGWYCISKCEDDSPYHEADKISSRFMGFDCLKPFRKENGEFLKSGEIVEIPVLRDGEEINLRIKTETKLQNYKYRLFFHKEEMSELQMKCFNKWNSF